MYKINVIKKSGIVFLFFLLSITVTFNLTAQIKVACVGDSITAGYGLSNP